MKRYRLALGVRLVATEEGVIGLLPQSRSLGIHLGSRELEGDLVGTLAGDGEVGRLREKYGAPAVDAAVAALEQHVLIAPIAPVLEVDLHLDPEASVDSALAGEVEWTSASISAPLGSPLLGSWLRELRLRRLPALVAWTAGTAVAIGFDDARSGPCLRCALTFDRELRHVAPGVLQGKSLGPSTQAHARSLAAAVLTTMSQPGAARPPVGSILLLDAASWASEWESHSAHPACDCAVQLEASAPACGSWAESKSRRFSPLLCLDEGEGARPARVLFRRTRKLSEFSPSDYGIASASGEASTLRAFAEGVERFCMLHSPPDVRATPAAALNAPSFDEATIHSSLFSKDARGVAGFRHPDFDMAMALDWSWAVPAVSFGSESGRGARRLLPTGLIGRPSEGTPRLIDPSSSGYAAHTDRVRAVALAALEIIERDAVLLWWHARTPIIRIRAKELPASWEAETEAYLVTQDIDVPVVMLVARLPSGGLRLTSAAATTFNGAWTKAVAEMDAALWTLKRFGVRPLATPLSDPRGRHGPTDHLAHYLERANAEQVFAQLAACSTDLDVKQLESEWGVTDAESLPAVLAAVDACGMEAWVVDRSLPALFGPAWHVVRVFLPDSLEVAWGGCYPRLGSRRYGAALRRGRANLDPHPIA